MTDDALRIDMADEQDAATWAAKLDVTADQLREAIEAVGDRASDVELHLKGTRATTTADEEGRANTAGEQPS